MEMSSQGQSQWYVIQTKPHKEDLVERQLSQVQVEVFCPKIKSFSPSIGGHRYGKKDLNSINKVTIPTYLKTFFPSYLFTRANLDDPKIHRMIRFTRGVNRILGTREQPTPLPEMAIDLIKQNLSDCGYIEFKTLKPGMSVRVKRGLLRDLIGILEKPVDTMGRVRVLLRLINTNIRTLLHCTDIEQVSP